MKHYPKIACLLVLVAVFAITAWARSSKAKRGRKATMAEIPLANQGEVKWIELDVSMFFGEAADMNGMSLILETRPEDPTYPHTYQGAKRGWSDGQLVDVAWYEYRIQDGEWVVEAWNTKGCRIEWRGDEGFSSPPFDVDSSICHPADVTRNRWDDTEHDGVGTNWEGAYVAWRGEPFDRSLQVYDLTAGWHLVSLPGHAENPARHAVFPPDKISAVWEFNNPGGYNIPDVIVPKKAYWIKADEPVTFSVVTNHPGNPAVTLQPGWSMVGVVEPRRTDNLGWQLMPDVEAIWEFKDGYEVPAVCWEGSGFWVCVEQETVIWEELQ